MTEGWKIFPPKGMIPAFKGSGKGQMFRMRAGVCHYCSTTLFKTYIERLSVINGDYSVLRRGNLFPDEHTFDHVIPKSKGGRSIHKNKVPCCLRCNRLKSNRTAEWLIETLRKQGSIT